jgi:hypothetical protein
MVVLVSGVAVKRNRELLDGRWAKHDTKDAANIADLISQGKCLFSKTEAGAQNGRIGFERRSERETLGYGDPGYFQINPVSPS